MTETYQKGTEIMIILATAANVQIILQQGPNRGSAQRWPPSSLLAFQIHARLAINNTPKLGQEQYSNFQLVTMAKS